MKKRNVILTTLCFITVVLVYVAFCLRYCYLKLPIEFEAGIPPDARLLVEEWYHDSDTIPYEAVSGDKIYYALLHPYKPTENRYVAGGNDGIVILTCSTGEGYKEFFFEFLGGKWHPPYMEAVTYDLPKK